MMAAAGVVLNVVIVATALLAVHEGERATSSASRVARAQRAFQDADMMHDALRADVYAALAAASGGLPPGGDEPVRDSVQHADQFRKDLADIAELELPDGGNALLRDVAADQRRYVESAEALAQLPPRSRGQLVAGLDQFRELFAQLEAEQARVTDELADLEKRTTEADQRRRANTEHVSLVAALAALLGVLALAAWLNRFGRGLGRALEHERAVATTLQDAMLPRSLPSVAGLRVAARYVPAQGAHVGGDWYDVFLLPSGDIGLVVGDVAGHDIDAAAAMGQLRNALRAYAAEGGPPGAVLTRLNVLCARQDQPEMATCLYAVIDVSAGLLTVANAGHCPPVKRSPESEPVLLWAASQPPVGATHVMTYRDVVHELAPGSLLVLYTDGLVERRGTALDRGLAELLGAVGQSSDEDLEGLCDTLLDRIRDDDREDDVALLAVGVALELGPQLELSYPAVPGSLMHMRRAITRWLQEAGATDAESYEVLVAVGEAATNALEHAYGPGQTTTYTVVCRRRDDTVEVVVCDSGQWRAPRGRDRGRGVDIMRALMDTMVVVHDDTGTEVRLSRRLGAPADAHAADVRCALP